MSDMQFEQPASKISTVVAVNNRQSSKGNLIFVEVEHIITQQSKVCIREIQSLVFASNTGHIPKIETRHFSIKEDDQVWVPSSIELFRFSAATFNSHRIHYDLDYAINAEGYPGLVVQGPLTAARLLAFAERKVKQIRSFTFRATAPLFADQPIVLSQVGPEEFHAIRCDGTLGMKVSVNYE